MDIQNDTSTCGRQTRISRICDCYGDYENGVCPFFECELREWCDKGFKLPKKKLD